MFQPFERILKFPEDLPALIQAMEALADPDAIANLANAAALLNWYYEDINWVGFYLWNDKDGELVLGPFQGLPACIRISPERGVCGKAARSGEIQIVEDVNLFPDHIACDAASRSEMVVPIFTDEKLIGVLDIDSPVVGRFNESDAEAMGEFCRVLGGLIDFQR